MKKMSRIFSIPNKSKIVLALVLVMLLSLALVVVASAQTGDGFDLSWNVLGAGGGKSSLGNAYELTGTLGQTAVSASSGSNNVQSHGFWQDMIGVIHSMLPFTVKH
jgi:hypothetical protein